MAWDYVHGFAATESDRLCAQAHTLERLLHEGTRYAPGASVLEAACGVGAQTVLLARNSPSARITSVDLSETSLQQARARLAALGVANVVFHRADLNALPFEDDTFDHAFVCFVLEHLSRPYPALAEVKRVVRSGGTLTVIEGDHGSAIFYPSSHEAETVIACQIALQQAAGGDPLIGRRLYSLLNNAGFDQVRVSPIAIYVDQRDPEMAEGFIRQTFAAMIMGVRDEAIKAGLIEAAAFDAGMAALHRTAENDGVFCYTFFKAICNVT